MPEQPPSNRAYLYARSSSAGQNEQSRIGQFEAMAKYARSNGLVDAGRFEDVGSGLNTNKRPNYVGMIAEALKPENNVSHIVVNDLSRLTRSKTYPHSLLELLDEHGIAVHSVMDGKRSDTDDFIWDIHFSLNHQQSRKISQLSLQGQYDAVMAGYACSPKIPHGYLRGWVAGVKGQQHPIYVINPVTSEHVRIIFNKRDEGYRTVDICQHLFDLGIPSPTGLRRWTTGTVLGILKNRAYLGELEYFKSSRSMFPRNRSLYGPITYVGAHEPLIDEDLFNRVQKSIADNTRNPKNSGKETGISSPRSRVSPNPLSDMVKCGECSIGSDDPVPNMVVMNSREKNKKDLICSAKKSSGVACCQSSNIPLEPFLDLIVRDLVKRALTMEVLQEQIQYINDNSTQLVADERERQAAIKKRIKGIKSQEANLLETVRNHDTSHPRAATLIMDNLEKLSKDREDLESQGRNLDDNVSEALTFATEPEAIIEAAIDLRTYLEADDKTTVRYLLRGFIKRVDVAKGKATIHYGLPLPDTQETESGYSTEVALDDQEILLEHRSPLRTGQHHPHFQQGLRRMGRTAGRQRDRLGGAGPPAAPQPRTEHPRRKLPAQGETPGGAIPVATPHQRSVGGGRRQLRALTKSLSKYQVVQF